MRQIKYRMLFSLLFYVHVTCANAIDLFSLLSYANKLPKVPKSDELSPGVFSYASFYTQRYHSFFDRWASFFGMYTVPFSKQLFTTSLSKVVQQRELEGLVGDFVQKVSITKNHIWYIFGSLHGSFHALVEGLLALYKQGYITKELELVHAHHSIVFCGNFLSNSAYAQDTLQLILLLMQNNPNNVFCIKGVDEQAWQDIQLKEELSIRFGEQWVATISSLLDRFFNTLPLSLYLQAMTEEIVAIRFSAIDKRLNDRSLASFFSDKKASFFRLKERPLQGKKIYTQAVIEGFDPEGDALSGQKQEMNGLLFKMEKGRYVWQLLSIPTVDQQQFGFHKRSFIALKTARHFAAWRLIVYQEDMATKDAYRKINEYDVANGQELFINDNKAYIKTLEERIETYKQEQERILNRCNA